MKLITEHIDSGIEYIVEANDKGGKNVFIEGVFMQADKPNRNGRVYPKGIMESAVGKYFNEQVKTGRAVGELNHPDGPTINLDKVSHRITDLRFEGSNVIGKALILDTPMGKIVKGLVEGGVKLGVSSRGMGSLERREGVNYVKDDFVLSTVDIVQDPSAPEAFVNGIMEGVEYFFEGNKLVAIQAEKYQSAFKKMSTKELAEQQAYYFKKFLDDIKVK